MTDHTQDPALFAQRPQASHAEIPPQALEWMLLCMANDLQLLEEARLLVAPHHFTREAPLRLLYQALCLSVDRFSGVTWESLTAAAAEILENEPEYGLSQTQLDILFRRGPDGLFWQVCHPDVELNDTNRALARDILQRFAHERTVVEPLRRVLNPALTPGVPTGLSDLLGAVSRQQERLAVVGRLPEVELVPEYGSELQAAQELRKTGVAFLDDRLGGQRVGDCNGLLGPTGGGKTTLAIHMAAAAVRQCWAEAAVTGTDPELVVFLTYEESGLKLRPRIWSNFFRIPRESLETMTTWENLSTQETLRAYEREMQRDQDTVLSETERYQLYGPQLASCFRLVDLSGSDEFPEAGNGYVGEVAAYLSRFDRKIHSVFIDYAGLVCSRYMESQGKNDPYYYRQLLKNFGDRCRKDISERFGCTVWAVHQLRGEAGSATPYRLMRHTDAAESRDFAVNMAVCMCLGVEDPVTGCRRLNISKCRYRANTDIPPGLLRIHDKFAMMEDATSRFVVDEASRRILSTEDARTVGGLDRAIRQQPGSGPPGLVTTADL